TPEASVHDAYKESVRAAEIDGTTTVGSTGAPLRLLRNDFAAAYRDAAARGASAEELAALFGGATLQMAALRGGVARGKVEAGQSAGLIDDIVPAGELVARLMREFAAAVERVRALLPQREPA